MDAMFTHARRGLRGTLTVLGAIAIAWVPQAWAQGPVLKDGRLVFPEGGEVSRAMTPAEREFLRLNPDYFNDQTGAGSPFADRVGGVRPVGPILCPGEYAPAQAILMSWDGSSGQNAILAQMTRHITTTGNAEAFMVVDTTSEQTTVTTSLTSAGADMSKVRFIVRGTDSIWIRDYGPRFVYLGTRGVPGQGAVRGIVRHIYNRPRPNDNNFSVWFATNGFAGQRKHPWFDLGLTHGGGNYHLDSVQRSYATVLIQNENPTVTTPDIISTWSDFQNVQTTLMPAFPTSVDSTQHIDMWMQIIADDRVIISDWPSNAGSTQDVICDNAAAMMQSLGYTVFRTPARLVNGVHYTYTNMVLCNDLVLLPTYSNSTMVAGNHNAQALAVLQQALDFDNSGEPDKTIVQIGSDALASSAGVMHCIVMHVPAHAGAPGTNGLSPTAHITALNTPQTLTPGQIVPFTWLTDDDKNIGTLDVDFSADGGLTFPLRLRAGISDNGQFQWTVPQIPTTKARLRVTVRDLDGNTGVDTTDADVTIAGTPCPADFNLDRVVDDADFVAFASAYEAFISPLGDLTGDGFTDDADFVLFAAAYEAFVCP